jgi:hypothetical protein
MEYKNGRNNQIKIRRTLLGLKIKIQCDKTEILCKAENRIITKQKKRWSSSKQGNG